MSLTSHIHSALEPLGNGLKWGTVELFYSGITFRQRIWGSSWLSWHLVRKVDGIKPVRVREGVFRLSVRRPQAYIYLHLTLIVPPRVVHAQITFLSASLQVFPDPQTRNPPGDTPDVRRASGPVQPRNRTASRREHLVTHLRKPPPRSVTNPGSPASTR